MMKSLQADRNSNSLYDLILEDMLNLSITSAIVPRFKGGEHISLDIGVSTLQHKKNILEGIY